MLPDIHIVLLIIFASSIFVSMLFQRLQQPSIVGFLLTGIVVGPHALRLLNGQEEIEQLAQVGVVMLLFTIGMELSIKDILKSKIMVFIGGGGQVVLTILLGLGLGLAVGLSFNSAVFLGFIICLSSTAIGLSLLQKYGSLTTPMGRLCLLILIFQDLIVVPLMLLTPLLGGEAINSDVSTWVIVGKGVFAILVILVVARWAAPWAMHQIAASRSTELFIIALVTLCIAICSLTVWAGLSLALGAFIAGMIIASSPYSHQAIGYIMPLRDIFTSLFFVSIGMLLNVSFVMEHPFLVVGSTLVVFIGKAVIIALVSLALKLPVGQSIMAGLALAPISEFSFVLAGSGISYHLVSDDAYQLFLAAAVLTMIITPFAFSIGRKYMATLQNNWSLMVNLNGGLGESKDEDEDIEKIRSHLHDHVIIVGFGPTGRMVAHACRIAEIPYIIVEMNAVTVRTEREKGENIVYGDAANEAILHHVNAAQAQVLVVTTNSAFLVRRTVTAARAANSSLYIITRTSFINDNEALRSIGASEVVVDEFETGLNMFSRVLKKLSIPLNDISRLIEQLKKENYGLLKSSKPFSSKFTPLYEYVSHLEFSVLRVEAGSRADGKSLKELNMQEIYGISVLAVKRNQVVEARISGQLCLSADDIVAVYGEALGISQVQHSLFMHVSEADNRASS